MEFDKNKHLDDWDDHSGSKADKPNAWRVEDDKNLNEKNLERNLYGKSESNMKPVKEGQAMGGHSLGKNNNTPAGDDKNNPSQNAGYTNAYFARTEPAEEHPENNNFKVKNQEGSPDYTKAQPYANWNSESPKPARPEERGDGENDRPHEESGYQEGTADNENEPNIAGPNEVPDQQKVGEDIDADDIEHTET
ncbi:hypothetical protein [Mucilaginibacter xinganensis]|uniref:Uncharacterized protein n=1 Tax=Mucilaginibacter xinganensis TaxID=1234841 RepID=A0A223NVZ0_9SPHI|nr:hypothetical protein [Mucilaginibacter xinganensis]ASU34045.1 hypothetical protein MuYL_2155 [Mucilaginibacter xinganensis]